MDKKLFELLLGTPNDSDKIAFGNNGVAYKNVTVGDFRSLMQGETAVNKTVSFEIGSWNMDTSSSNLTSIYVPSPVLFFSTPILPNKIRIVSVMIVDDNGIVSDFLSVQDGIPTTQPQINITYSTYILPTTFVNLTRRTGSLFDSSNYIKTANLDASPYNRGWITVTYVD